ncbi:methyltransferase family protein [Anaeromyxobacter oryzae]|uniref:Membrane protein n=1 Tax=Anaeromyxobacter oryzae TaxID=2918170 RepID=A0ABN6MZ31_9BACT|nr:isoprenylcysteine carboxylmethyltransferase family protein [Anaeromyxobacter oryzae]BDG04983.1 membrane protein [Anaeromyxobacter oryzae]
MPGDSPAVLWMKSVAGIAWLQLVLAAALFGSAGTLRYWQAWLYWSVFLGAVLVITIHFLRHDPDLIRRRLAVGPVAERRRVQQVVQALATLCFLALFVASGLDRRFRWSSVPSPVSLAADALVVLGFAIVFLVFRENSHTSALVEVSAGQRVVSTGPYRHVRHPMYAGALLLLAATPPALGSLVALPFVVALAGVIVARLVDEERLLASELPGYRAYCGEVRYRLVPRVW